MDIPIHQLERSYGDFPREHQYSSIEGLKPASDNPGLDMFLTSAEKLVTQWSGDKFAGLYLYGEPGTGKTHAAIALARALHEAGASIHYRLVPSWRPLERTISDGMGNSRIERVEPHITNWIGRVFDTDSDTPYPFPTSRRVNEEGFSSRMEEVHDKSVLILDDYKPFARNYVASAIEAASQYGGLVIVTSNYSDPFKMLDDTPEEKQLGAQIDALAEITPSISHIANVIRDEQSAKRDALRSRIAASFRFIHFEGEDRRMQTSFWND